MNTTVILELVHQHFLGALLIEGAKDTMADAVSLKTYTPSLKMFKEDITEIMNLRKNSHHSRNQH